MTPTDPLSLLAIERWQRQFRQALRDGAKMPKSCRERPQEPLRLKPVTKRKK